LGGGEQVRGKLFISDCGGYYCRALGNAHFEVWTSNGTIHWREDSRRPLCEYPIVYCVGGYSCQKKGQKEGSFTLNLLHCDTQIKILVFKGNTIIDQKDVVFRRRIQSNHVNSVLRKIGADALAKGQEDKVIK
jgi:hypothetical protein